MSFKKAVLITGGAGAIGSRLADRLAQDPACRVIVLDNLSSGRVENVPTLPNVRFLEGGVESDQALQEAFDAPIDVVFHLAANFANQNSVDFPLRDLQVQGVGTLKTLLKSVERKAGRFLYVSSSCVYGNCQGAADERHRGFEPQTPYAVTKLLGERYVEFFRRHHGLRTVVLRYFNVYGPNERPGKYRNVIPNFFYRALRNEDLMITGSGDDTRDFNFVEDTVRATILAAENEAAVGGVFNIASGRETKIKDLAALILEVSGSRSKVVYGPRRDWDEVARRAAATADAKAVLGYEPRVSLRDGLTRYHEWLTKQDLSRTAW